MTPKRLDNKSEAGSQLNLEALYTIAPFCFTEVQDPKTGETKQVVNFDILRTLLGDDALEGEHERYQFTWPGKQAARLEATVATTETLRPVPCESLDWDKTENIYIEGDNLRVLKLLQKSYLGKIKMIYIDPPYNTGNDFVYHDDFKRSTTEEELAAGNIDLEGIRYRRNTDRNGRFHSDWCSMMLSRLLVAHSLLAEDGVIFISIDDNEVHNLRKICDEVFGERNFVGEVIWQSATDNNPRQISTEHEYLLCFSKQAQNLPNWLIASENAQKIELQYEIIKGKFLDIKSQQEELRKWIKVNKAELKGVTHYNNVDEKGVYSNSSNSSNTKPGGYMFDIIHPITHKPCVKPTFGWRWPENTFWNYDATGDIEWGADETTQPHVKKRISSVKEQLKSIYYEDGRVSTKGLEQLFEAKKIFDNPKPLKLIKRLINFTTQKEALILDFFSGSATTAHAVMQLNAEDLKAGKEGKRKYICVQLAEKTPEDSEARKAGYNTIPEIAKERIRRAGKKIKEENPEVADTLDTGFRVFKLDSSNYEEVSKTPNEYDQAQLDLFLDNIKTNRNDLDLLFGAMLSWGVPLSLSQPLQTEVVDGCTIYNVTDGELVACFAEEVSEAVVRAMATMHPERVLFRDSCFAEDKMKINLFELFKQALDWDEREALDNIRVI